MNAQAITTPPKPAGLAKETGNVEFTPHGAADKIKLSIAIVRSYVAIPTRSGAQPTDRDCMRFMALCQAQRLNPFAGDCFLTGYDSKNGPVFSLIVAHLAFLKRAESSPDFEGMESGIILQDEASGQIVEREGDFKMPEEICVGGWARVFRKGRKPTYRRLAIAAYRPAYDTQFWNEDKAPGQIVKCAEADALRSTFPTLLGGMLMREEMEANLTPQQFSDALSLPAKETHQIREGEVPVAVNFAPNAERQAVPVASDPSPTMTQAKTAVPGGLHPDVETLRKTVESGKLTFEHFLVYGDESGNVPADAMSGWQDLNPTVAKRLNRSGQAIISQIVEAVKLREAKG